MSNDYNVWPPEDMPEVELPTAQRTPFDTSGRLKAEGPGPFPEGHLLAPDVARFPWTRDTGNTWTTPAFRALFLAWLQVYLKARPDLVAWDVEERAQGRNRSGLLPPERWHLIVGVRKQVRSCGRLLSDERFEAAADFPPDARAGAAAQAIFALLGASLDALGAAP